MCGAHLHEPYNFKTKLLQDISKAFIIIGGHFNACDVKDAPHSAVDNSCGLETKNPNGSPLKAFFHRNRIAIVHS